MRRLTSVGLLVAMAALRFASAQQEKPYVLGTGDQLSVEVADVDEFNGKSVRIDDSGSIILPKIGKTEASGKTIAELQASIASRLSKYVAEARGYGDNYGTPNATSHSQWCGEVAWVAEYSSW